MVKVQESHDLTTFPFRTSSLPLSPPLMRPSPILFCPAAVVLCNARGCPPPLPLPANLSQRKNSQQLQNGCQLNSLGHDHSSFLSHFNPSPTATITRTILAYKYFSQNLK